MARKPDSEADRLDDAARAGWLYYIAGNTQDEIAAQARRDAADGAKAGVALGQRKADQGEARSSDQPLPRPLGAAEIRLRLRDLRSRASRSRIRIPRPSALPRRRPPSWNAISSSQHPIIVAMGTGRMMRAMAEQMTPMDCPQHKIVSLVGNIAPDGSASLYDVSQPYRRYGEGAALSDAAAGHRHHVPRKGVAAGADSRCATSSSWPIRPMLPSSASAASATRRRCCRTDSSRPTKCAAW